MNKAIIVLTFVGVLAGCAAAPVQYSLASPCEAKGEAAYDCQVYRYLNVP